MLGWLLQRSGEYDASYQRLSYAMSLRPDLPLAYTVRSQTALAHARSLADDDETERRRLLSLSLQDASGTRDLMRQYETGHWLRGNSLRALNQPPLAVTAYLDALKREPPLDMLSFGKMSIVFSQKDPNEVRRLSFVLTDRFQQAKEYGRQVRESDPANPQYALLEALASLELVDPTVLDDPFPAKRAEFAKKLKEAESAAERLSAIIAETPAEAELTSMTHAIDGGVQLHRRKLPAARDAFTEALRIDPQNTRAAIGLARTLESIAMEEQDPLQLKMALAVYEQLEDIAFTDWQRMLAGQGQFRVLLQLRKETQAIDTLGTMWQRDRGLDLVKLKSVAEENSAAEALQEIQRLQSELQRVFASDVDELPATLPLRNGHFELGLAEYWLPWNTANCVADAVIDRQSQPSGGNACLRIEHRSPPSSESYGQLVQQFPAPLGQRFRITLQCKGNRVSAGGFRVVINENRKAPAIVLPQGSYDWQELTGEFELPSAEGDRAVSEIQLRIVSSAPGTVWIDDIQIERVEE